jgi:hypothetical protein
LHPEHWGSFCEPCDTRETVAVLKKIFDPCDAPWSLYLQDDGVVDFTQLFRCLLVTSYGVPPERSRFRRSSNWARSTFLPPETSHPCEASWMPITSGLCFRMVDTTAPRRSDQGRSRFCDE